MTIGVCKDCECLFLMRTGKEPGCVRCYGELRQKFNVDYDIPSKSLKYIVDGDPDKGGDVTFSIG